MRIESKIISGSIQVKLRSAFENNEGCVDWDKDFIVICKGTKAKLERRKVEKTEDRAKRVNREPRG